MASLACLTLLDSLSRAYETSDPDLAVAFNPANTDARIRRSVAALNAPNSEVSAAAINKDLAFVRQYAPIDARAISLLGEQRLRAGDVEEARRLYEGALRVAPTELHSLKRLIGLDLGDGELSSATDKVSVLLKRWPTRFSEFADIFPPLMRTGDGYRAVLETVAEDAAWRGRLLDHLATGPDTAPLAYRLLLDLRSTVLPVTPREVDRVVGQLLRAGNPQLAYQAFALTRTPAELQNAGYVTNSEFSKSAAASPFDWSLPRVAGVEAEILTEEMGPGGSGGLRVQFRRKPVKGAIARQVLMLPPGDLELSTESTARSLETPKGLFWEITCSGSREPLIVMSVEPGRYDHSEVSVRFSVPATGCQTQQLTLSTGVIAPSMRYRYDGSLIVHRISVRQTDAD
ncbi:hypothetical protein VQ042_23220 [Aurantimonas sp. A2-1-M11]|uniref:hypothetical protein n=1 Tax=Aurantimonas sp. A2-1-M11 TaxID=3113712 RepID=UPI002F9484ED